ncbi:gloverin-like [Achroia grisella]|uniref:gloverin-like n=1 Tax=Achroia grisella TaxID=688607 RepID=UPI0027D2CD38|nr:gloverin-like [Achroia grisella]
MQSLYIFAGILAVVATQEYIEIDRYPDWYVQPQEEHLRHRRQLSVDKSGDVTYAHGSPNNKVFGTLGSRGENLFGKLGYQHNFINDDRGKLTGTAYGTRVLSPYGNSNHLGGRVDWAGRHTAASLDVSKQLHGPTSIQAAGGAKWPIGRNGEMSLQGTYNRFGGMQDYGGRLGYIHRF